MLYLVSSQNLYACLVTEGNLTRCSLKKLSECSKDRIRSDFQSIVPMPVLLRNLEDLVTVLLNIYAMLVYTFGLYR